MSEARGSERSVLDTGEAGDRRRDSPLDVAMEMTTAATPTATGETITEPMEKSGNGKRRRRSEALAACSDWRSRMQRTMRQQAQELTQLHQTVRHLTNLVQAQEAPEEAQSLGMRTWMQQSGQKRDARHEDDKVWGMGITNMLAKVMKGVAPGQEAREKERDKTAEMDGGGLEALQHADTTQEGGPEKRQQLQQQPKPRLRLKLQPKLRHGPKQKPKSAPTPATGWETVPPQTQSQRAPIGSGGSSTAERHLIIKRGESVPLPGPAPTSAPSMADRRLILRRDESIPLPEKMDEEIASAVNRALCQQLALAHGRIMNARRNAKGTIITAITHQNATAEIALRYRDMIIMAARSVDKGIIDVQGNESWERLEIHTVPLVRYIGEGTEGLQKMREEIQADNEGVAIPAQVRWLSNPRIIREREQRGEIKASSVVFIVRGKKVAQRVVSNGEIAAGVRYKVEAYTNAGPDSLCGHWC